MSHSQRRILRLTASKPPAGFQKDLAKGLTSSGNGPVHGVASRTALCGEPNVPSA
jgi:hypothetical protein